MSTDRESNIRERFQRETADHTMTVLHDDGLYRHLRFKSPERGAYWFDLITWPFNLVVKGSPGSFTFCRFGEDTEDMFALFRDSRSGRQINPHYWAEKVIAGEDRVMTYSQDLFNALVAEDLKESEADWPGVTAAWNEHANGFLAEYNTEYEHDARAALNSFEYLPEGDDGEPFRFQDTWEWQLKDYNLWFLWACHAIVWGIAQYDAAKQAPADTGRAA